MLDRLPESWTSSCKIRLGQTAPSLPRWMQGEQLLMPATELFWGSLLFVSALELELSSDAHFQATRLSLPKHTPKQRVVSGHRTFKTKAMEVSGAAQKLTEGLSGKRDLAKLSPWLAEFSAASGNWPGALHTCGLSTMHGPANQV